MTKGETITYKGVTYVVKEGEEGSLDACGNCDLCKDFIEPFGNKVTVEVCNWDCPGDSLYLKRKRNNNGSK